jgi:hypothetical protein
MTSCEVLEGIKDLKGLPKGIRLKTLPSFVNYFPKIFRSKFQHNTIFAQ